MDVSTDLIELGRTPITVVCAGAKSILDIGKTLEVLVWNYINKLQMSVKKKRSLKYFCRRRKECLLLVTKRMNFPPFLHHAQAFKHQADWIPHSNSQS